MVLAEGKLWGACPLTAIVAWRCRVADGAATASIGRGQVVVVVAGDGVVVFYLRHIVAASAAVAKEIVATIFRGVVDSVVDI